MKLKSVDKVTGEENFLSGAEFKNLCIRTKCGISYVKWEEALHWATVGRVGSHFDMDGRRYEMVEMF